MTPGWPVTLEHDQIGVRPLKRADARTWETLRRQNSAWLTPWEATLPQGSGETGRTYPEMVRTLRSRARHGQSMPFVITYDAQMVGQLTVGGITWGSARWATIGYWIGQNHAGKAITTTAVALVCDHLLGKVGMHRIEISIRPENSASLRVVEKLGFEEVGLARRFLHIDGQWRDHRIFQILAEDAAGGLINRL